MRLQLALLRDVGQVGSWHAPGAAALRGMRYHWSSAGILLLIVLLFLIPTDAGVEPATASLEPATGEGLLGQLEFAATGSRLPVLESRGPQSGQAPGCQAPAYCWDPSSGWLGTGTNAVFYGPLLPFSGLGSVSGLLQFRPGTGLSFVLENGHRYEYSIVRATRIPTNDPQLRGYAAPTPGQVITLIDCGAPVDSDPADYCQRNHGDAFVVRAEALAPTPPLPSPAIGAAPRGSWSNVSIELPALFAGHLLFLTGLAYFAWRSWSSRYGRPSREPGRIRRQIPFLVVSSWLLLGLALAELGTKYSLSGELEVAGMDWLWGGAIFAGALLFASYLLTRLELESGRSLLLLAGVLTSLGLIAIYYWETRSATTGHALFFTQAGASAAGLLLCLAAAWAVARARALSLFSLPAFNTLAGLTVVGLALVTALASFSGRPPMLSMPAVGTITLSPLLQIATVICLVGALGQGLSKPRGMAGPNPRAPWWLWLAPGSAIMVLLFADVGMALVLAAATCLTAMLTPGLPAKRLALIGGVLVVLTLPTLLDRVGAAPAQMQGRLEAWLDPWGFLQESERTNHVVRAFRQIVARRFEAGVEPEIEGPRERSRPAIAPAVSGDIDKVALELSYRLHGVTRGEAEVAEGLVPKPGSGDEGLLLIAEELWSGLGGYRWGGQEDGLAALAEKADGAVARLREMASRLAEWELEEAGKTSDGLQATGSTTAQLESAYLNVVEPRADDFQQTQSLLALRSGRLIGTGWGLGEPERLPVVTEDLPVVLVGETLGFLGTAAIVVIIVRILSIGLRRAEAQRDCAAALLGYSLVALLGLQSLIAIGGGIGLLPLTGIPLPFASRGGSSLVAYWIAIGLLMGLPAGIGTPRYPKMALAASSRRLRTPAAAIGFAVLATLFAIQGTGHSVSPGALWARLPDDQGLDGHPVSPAYAAGRADSQGTILDRDGRVLAWRDAASNGGRYPNQELARSLSHTLASLETSFRKELDRSGEQALLSPLGGRFWAPDGGRVLVTTIDGEIQEAVHRAFDERLRWAGLNPETAKGAAVVLDATTGEILALESRPTFDPEALWDEETWAKDEAEARRQGVTNRLLNRGVLGTYPPGSTFKVVTAAAALESGLYTPEPKVFQYTTTDQGSRWHQLELPDGELVTDANHPRPGDWSFNLDEALAWSCNVAFAEVATTLGPEAILDMAQRFGFERQIQIQGLGTSFSAVDSGHGTSSPHRFVRATIAGLAHTGFGQGQLSVNPLQMALVSATVANSGVLMEPHVVAAWRTADGRTLAERLPRSLLPAALSQHTVTDLQTMLWSSVTDGWASDARVNYANREPGVAGKTGTAEWSQDGHSPHSWFIGYYPAERPRIALAVVVEQAGESHVASFIARDIFGDPSVNSYLGEDRYSSPLSTGEPPTVVSAEPGENGLQPVFGEVKVVFDQPMDRTSVEESFRVEPQAAGSSRWLDDWRLVWQPSALLYSTTYRISVGGISQDGDPLAQDFSWQFRTQDPPPPMITPGDKGTVVLTFDDYGSKAQVEAILDILDDNLVKAIFFPVGNWAELNPELIQRMNDEGHVVGNHTYSHAHLAALTEEEVRWEIENGPGSYLLRLPYGEHNAIVDRVAEELGYQIYGWNVDPEDWKGVTAQQAVETVILEVRPGSVVMLHMHGEHSGEALKHLIPLLRQAGYEFWRPGEPSP